ncbi:hypothetical protein EF879_23720 [Micromonospora sp. HM5-17]|nr:hypothetical protein EF879_23720 [Micromonospora sp. HM5-17]
MVAADAWPTAVAAAPAGAGSRRALAEPRLAPPGSGASAGRDVPRHRPVPDRLAVGRRGRPGRVGSPVAVVTASFPLRRVAFRRGLI